VPGQTFPLSLLGDGGDWLANAIAAPEQALLPLVKPVEKLKHLAPQRVFPIWSPQRVEQGGGVAISIPGGRRIQRQRERHG
jgi:hypothetical protein